MVRFGIIANGTIYPIKVVGNMAWGGTQAVIIYEAPGTDGGTVLMNGRLTRKRTLNGRILHIPGMTLTEVKNIFEKIRDNQTVVTLISPIDDDDTGKYVIEEFSGQVLEGIESYLPFTMGLIEYKQANIKRARVNLIAFEPAERVKQIIAERNAAASQAAQTTT